MKKINFFAVLLVLIFSSCQDDNYHEAFELENSETKRVTFKNYDAFNKQVDDLSKLSSDELNAWTQKNNPNSLYNNSIEDDYLSRLPNSYKAILNDRSEFIISDKIYWLSKGDLYEFNFDDNIDLLKGNPKALKPVGEIKVSVLDTSINDSDVENKTIMGMNDLKGSYQKEFRGYRYLDCSTYRVRNVNALFKYVHELITVETRFSSYGRYSRLYLKVKLEWRSRRRWKRAGEPRSIKITLNLNGTHIDGGLDGVFGGVIPVHGSNYINLNLSCAGDQTILLKRSDSYFDIGPRPNWVVNINGYIKHSFNGGYHTWNNRVVW